MICSVGSEMKEILIKAPATTANLGPGFDVFGMALERPSDKVRITLIPKGLEIKVHGPAKEEIPTDPERNTAGVVAKEVLKAFSLGTGLRIEIEKGILPGVGLGSSAASAAAVAFGLNVLFNLEMDRKDLTRMAMKGEVVSAGFEHADNVSAAIYGGFVIVKSYRPLEIIHLEPPQNLHVAVAIPKVPVPPKKTMKARSVLPREVPMRKLVHNVGHAAALAAGFAIGDVDLIGRSMLDVVVEPARASLVPGYREVREKALEAGACGVALSGAGPSMIAVVNALEVDASKVAEAMREGFESAGLSAEAFYTRPGRGVHVLEENP
ncbi:homoserine kinase [Candidatus Bathyarchaeota archaeon]|nr:MAG: homoserine kinase [Candidatus Bathyarchaeota archaeon]